MQAHPQARQNTQKAGRHAPAMADAQHRHKHAGPYAAAPMFDDPDVSLIDPEFDSLADSHARFDARDRFF